MLRFNKTYFILAVTFFLVEVFIAMYVHDAVIRPYVGDLLVVILIYCFVRSFLNTRPSTTICFVLIFAFLVELSQYFNLVKHLGLQHSRIANVIMGNSFEWIDIIAYILGALIVWATEQFIARRKIQKVIRDIEL